MKKWLKRTLWIVIPLVLIIAGFLLWQVYPLFGMAPTKTGQVLQTNIYALQSSKNASYFIKTDDGYILIDTGTDLNGVEQSMAELQIAQSDVKWVLLTHSDYDHVGSLPLFSEAELYMSEDEAAMLEKKVRRNLFGTNNLPEGIALERFTLLKDGQTLSLGGVAVTCIKALGHTQGSMAYLIDEMHLFTGDAFMVTDSKVSIHPFTMDAKAAKETITHLKDIVDKSDLILTTHYGYFEQLTMDD